MATIKRRKIRLKKRKQTEIGIWKHVLYGFLAIACVLLVCTAIWHITRLPSFTIDSVTVSGGETISHESVRSQVENELRGSYFLLVPHRFSYFYPHEKVVARLESISKIYDVRVTKETKNELTVTFEEYIPHALWCTATDDSECYFISQGGYAFAPAPMLEGNTFISHIIEGVTELEEKQIFEPAELAAIDAFVRAIHTELSFRVGEIVHMQVGDIVYRINGGGELLVAGDMNVTETFENLKSILISEEFDHLKPGNFNYIDLRFGNKVFVNEELAPKEETETEKEEEPHGAALE